MNPVDPFLNGVSMASICCHRPYDLKRFIYIIRKRDDWFVFKCHSLSNIAVILKALKMESSNSDVLSKLFSWVQEDLRIWLLLFIILTLILLVILFRREIVDLFRRLSNVTYKGFSITFGENLKKAKQQKKNNNNLTGTSRAGLMR